MTYPPPEPGRQPDPPPADPFLSPPGWDQPYGAGPSGPGGPYGPTSPASPYGSPPPYDQPPQYGPPQYDPPPQYGPPQYDPPPPYGPPQYDPPPPYGAGGGGPGDPPVGPPYGPYGPVGPLPQPPRRGRRGLMIALVGGAAALVLCLGAVTVGFLVLRDTDQNGEQSPTAAVQAFLQAVYRDHSAAQASELVCSESRDEGAMEAKIAEITAYQETYVEPQFTWSSPQVVDESGELATVATTVTMVTGDEKTADLPLQVTVLDKGSNGWWVCDLETAPSTETEPPGESPSPAAEEDAESDSGG